MDNCVCGSTWRYTYSRHSVRVFNKAVGSITVSGTWLDVTAWERSEDPITALTVTSVLQRGSARQGPRGRLCVSGLPGSDQARRASGYVWMGSSCCQPAVQELQDPGPHHGHWVLSVHRLLLSFFLALSGLTSSSFILTSCSEWVLNQSCCFLSIQCKTRMRKPCRGRGKMGKTWEGNLYF